MTPIQTITKFGWIQGSLMESNGVCLIGACRLADWGTTHAPEFGPYELAARALMRRRNKRWPLCYRSSVPEDWNDSRRTTKAQVVSFLKRVERLVARLSRARSPLTTTTTVNIPFLCLKANQPVPLSWKSPSIFPVTISNPASATTAAPSKAALNQTLAITLASRADSAAFLAPRKQS